MYMWRITAQNCNLDVYMVFWLDSHDLSVQYISGTTALDDKTMCIYIFWFNLSLSIITFSFFAFFWQQIFKLVLYTFFRSTRLLWRQTVSVSVSFLWLPCANVQWQSAEIVSSHDYARVQHTGRSIRRLVQPSTSCESSETEDDVIFSIHLREERQVLDIDRDLSQMWGGLRCTYMPLR